MLNSPIKTLLSAIILVGIGLSNTQGSASPLTAFCQRIQHYYGLLKPHDLKWKVEVPQDDPLPHLTQILGTENRNFVWLATEILNLREETNNKDEIHMANLEEGKEFLKWAESKIRKQQNWLQDLKKTGLKSGEVAEIEKWQNEVLSQNSRLIQRAVPSNALRFKMHAVAVAGVLSTMQDGKIAEEPFGGNVKSTYEMVKGGFKISFEEKYLHPTITYRKLGMGEFIAIAYEPISLFSFTENYEFFDGGKEKRSPFDQIRHDGGHENEIFYVWATPTDFEGSPLAEVFLKRQTELGNEFLDTLYTKIRKTRMTQSQARAIELLLFYGTHEEPTLNKIWFEDGLFSGRLKNFRRLYGARGAVIRRRGNTVGDLSVKGTRILPADLDFSFLFIVAELEHQSQLHDKATEEIINELNKLMPEAVDH